MFVEALKTTSILAVIAAVFVTFLAAIFIKPIIGAYPFGPSGSEVVRVTRLYVDYSGGGKSSASHYMVGTDKGVFEVDNSVWLWKWDADKTYAGLESGKVYKIQTKGREVVNFFFQDYPGIVTAEEVK